MTLQSSGAISIAQMRDEYGLSNPVSMSDFYGKTGLPSSGAIRFSDFYGKSSYPDQQFVTVGKVSVIGNNASYGFNSEMGSINDGTSNLYGGAAITELFWRYDGRLYFSVTGTVANSGWTNMQIGDKSFSRSSADFLDSHTWRWQLTANPFGSTAGAIVTVTWT